MQVTGHLRTIVRRTAAVAASAVLMSWTAGPAGTPAAAEPSPGPAAAAGPGRPVCTITNPNLVELSGIVAVGGFYYVHNDSTAVAAQAKVFKLDSACKVAPGGVIPYPALSRDPEDMAVGPDGTIWIADTGDNGLNPVRTTVALWKMTDDKIKGPYRMSYPATRFDAEALLIQDDGTPLIITKDWGFTSTAQLFAPTGALRSGKTVPLAKVGELTLPPTSTPVPGGPIRRMLVTGAAQSPDRTRVALRSYADAFEWDVTGGDIVTALTTGTPRVTALPHEPQGEAITYSTDGTRFLTVSETGHLPPGDPARMPVLLSYTPTAPAAAAAAPASPSPAASGAPDASDSDTSFTRTLLHNMDLDRLASILHTIGAAGLLLTVLGILGILRARRRRRRETGRSAPASPAAPATARRDRDELQAGPRLYVPQERRDR